jgi:hypothetical protein
MSAAWLTATLVGGNWKALCHTYALCQSVPKLRVTAQHGDSSGGVYEHQHHWQVSACPLLYELQPVTQSVEQLVRWTAIPASTLKAVKQGQCASAGVCKIDPIKTL